MEWSKAILGLLVAGMAGLAWAGTSKTELGIEAVTAPSADITMSFVQAGCIAAVHVKYGESVKAGQLLIQQDDSVERVQLERLLAESSDTTDIEASAASLAQKKVDLKRVEEAAKGRAATDLEVEHARLDVKIAELTLQTARFEHDQARRRYEEAKTAVQRMTLNSPVDGCVERIYLEKGEAVNALDDAVRIIRIDPLWVDVPVPMEQAAAVRPGDSAQVLFPSPRRASVKGVVVFVSGIADAASGTLTVRVEVPNKTTRPAGERVEIVLGKAS